MEALKPQAARTQCLLQFSQPKVYTTLANQVTIIVPANCDLSNLEKAAQSCSNFELSNLTYSDMVNVAKSSKTALTVGNLSCDDQILASDNVLSLSLTEQTYLRAGLEAKKAPSSRYELQIQAAQLPARFVWSLENALPKEPLKCFVQSGVAEYHTGYMNMPEVEWFDKDDKESQQDWANEIQEVIGLAKISTKCEQGNAKVVVIKGMMSNSEVTGLLNSIESPFFVHIDEFANNPRSWGKFHRRSGFSLGNHGLSIIKNPDNSVLTLQYNDYADLS